YLDRGKSVTNALKNILGATCQICGWEGFEKSDGDKYIEAHHLVQVSEKVPGSLCTENIILLCPNCHRKIHHGREITVSEESNFLVISSLEQKRRIHRNTMSHLSSLAH
ncbi:MAG: hypothetical protein F3745_07370, partial [Nitrospinae bacterium]|nr:hypothetical protein [Nitrospinota bacterium]